jgi:hypothetical protein
MANELEAQAQIGGVKPESVGKPIGFTVRNITPAVYLTGLYTASPQAKAAELTRLLRGLLDLGIWSSTQEAFSNGVPAGTFVLVDNGRLDAAAADSREAARTIEIQVVTAVRKKKEEAK